MNGQMLCDGHTLSSVDGGALGIGTLTLEILASSFAWSGEQA